MVESETKQTIEETLHEEIKTLRQKLTEGKRTLEEFQGVIKNVVLKTPLNEEQIDELAYALYPLFKPVDLDGKTVVLEIPFYGEKIPDDKLVRYCAYIEFLKGMGAKQAIFIEKMSKLHVLSERELERFGLKKIDSTPDLPKAEPPAEA
jgi:hypothetical protein